MGKEATQAYVWVNGFYTGDTVEIKINAPPRPSANARLTIFSSESTPIDVTVNEYNFVPHHPYAILKFKSSFRNVEVTKAGEMKWQTGRDFKGKYYVYWEE